MIVIDTNPGSAQSIAWILHLNGYADIANQIEAQLEPARIAEPGLWGMVSACGNGFPRKRVWVRGSDGCWFYGSVIEDWDSLIDPTLIRDGV